MSEYLASNSANARKLLLAARVAHAVNQAYCLTIGDEPQPDWDTAPHWQRDSACAGVMAIAEGRVTTPADSHANWLAQKETEGWVYGAEKDPEAKTHPCMVPYDELPDEQRTKDVLFFAVVRSVLAQ